MGIFDEVKSQSSAGLQLFSGNSPLAQVGNALANQGLEYAKAKINTNHIPLLNAGVALANGDVMSAFNSVVNPQLLNRLMKNNNALRRQASPVTAYLSLEEVQRIVMTALNTEHARKNLWLLNISDYSASGFQSSLGDMLGSAVGNLVSRYTPNNLGLDFNQMASQATKTLLASNPITGGLNEMGGGITSQFNLLATNLSYAPFSIEADQHNVGSSVLDAVKSAQKTEISITTMDNEQGYIKRWFKNKASKVVHRDGTVGVLADGLVQIRVLHAFVSDNVNNNGFEETIICRPVGTEYEFDRREEGMQEFTLRFEQTDTFI